MTKKFVGHIIKSISTIHSASDDNVMIVSIPRSGSTWLMELIWSQPGFKICNEPLNMRNPAIRKASGLNSFEDLYSEDKQAIVIRYMKEIAHGKHRFLNPNPFRKHHKIRTNRIVYKVINGGESIINEMASATASKVIYLIRHPFTVSLSRQVLPRLHILCSDLVLNKLKSREAQEKALQVFNKGTYLEKAVLSWCIENQLALNVRQPDWVVCTYEQMITDPAPLIDLIAGKCLLPQPGKIYKGLNVPSAVTVQSDKGTDESIKGSDRSALVSKWREKIKPEEEKKLWGIVDAFELNIYDKQSSLPLKEFTI